MYSSQLLICVFLSLSATALMGFSEIAQERLRLSANYIITEVLFNHILQLPSPPQVLVYYSSVLIELCKNSPAVFPQLVSVWLTNSMLYTTKRYSIVNACCSQACGTSTLKGVGPGGDAKNKGGGQIILNKIILLHMFAEVGGGGDGGGVGVYFLSTSATPLLPQLSQTTELLFTRLDKMNSISLNR